VGLAVTLGDVDESVTMFAVVGLAVCEGIVNVGARLRNGTGTEDVVIIDSMMGSFFLTNVRFFMKCEVI
jgi:hypothetical protein